jgi:hypothetical protein
MSSNSHGKAGHPVSDAGSVVGVEMLMQVELMRW